MAKSFVISPLVGALAAVLGWFAALTFKTTMSDADFEALRFGWEGTLIGAIALACILLLVLTNDIIDSLMVVGAAAVGGALVWDRREFPFNTTNFRDGTTSGYWLAVSTMVFTFILLLMGLRAARESNNRARG